VSLKLRRITANNFRKFRVPVTIDGLTDGLNIVVEPNETGKSTLLEAIRAAFFVPHRSSNQLTRSYQPFGENVAPEVEVSFDVAGRVFRLFRRMLAASVVPIQKRARMCRAPSASGSTFFSRNGFLRMYLAFRLRDQIAISTP